MAIDSVNEPSKPGTVRSQHAFERGYRATAVVRLYLAYAMTLDDQFRDTLLEHEASFIRLGLIHQHGPEDEWQRIVSNVRARFNRSTSEFWPTYVDGLSNEERMFEEFASGRGEGEVTSATSALGLLSGNVAPDDRVAFEAGVRFADLEISMSALESARNGVIETSVARRDRNQLIASICELIVAAGRPGHSTAHLKKVVSAELKVRHRRIGQLLNFDGPLTDGQSLGFPAEFLPDGTVKLCDLAPVRLAPKERELVRYLADASTRKDLKSLYKSIWPGNAEPENAAKTLITHINNKLRVPNREKLAELGIHRVVKRAPAGGWEIESRLWTPASEPKR